MSHVEKPATISDLVTATGKSRPTVYRLIASGELPGYRTSRGYIVPRAWFEDWQHGQWKMPEITDEQETPGTTDELEVADTDEKKPIPFVRQRTA